MGCCSAEIFRTQFWMQTPWSQLMARSQLSAKQKDIDTENATLVIDAKGTTMVPGLIDSHVHPVAGDWTPRQNQIRLDRQLHARRSYQHDFRR